MMDLAAVVAPVIVPCIGGGVDISTLPTWGIVTFMVVVWLLIAFLGVILYGMNKDEFGGDSLGWEYKAMAIIMDALSLIIGFGGGVLMTYLSISELVSRF